MPLNPVDGTPANDSNLQGTAAADLIHGLAGNDWIYALDGDDAIHGDEGDDYVFAGNGDDTTFGGEGNDVLRGQFGSDVIQGGDGDDLLSGGDFGENAADWLYGGNGSDQLRGAWYGENAQGDHLFGGAGNDQLEVVYDPLFGLGGELHGGAGEADILIFTWSNSDLPAHGLQLAISGPDEGASFDGVSIAISGIEYLNIETGAGSDSITGGAFHDHISVGAGANRVFAGGGNDRITVYQGAGNVIFGGEGDDHLTWYGLDARATVFNLFNGIATDSTGSYIAEVESFEVWTGGRNDTVRLGDGDDLIGLGAGNDLAEAGGGDDEIEGGEGNDRLFGEAGHDVILPGLGDDRVEGGDGDDQLGGPLSSAEEAGDDVLIGGAGNDWLYGGLGDDSLTGGDGEDRLEEGDYGPSTHHDTLNGGAGDDTLIVAGYGLSTVNGGAGIDTLAFQLSYNLAGENIVLALPETGAGNTITLRGYTISSVERLSVTTRSGNDKITGGAYDDVIDVGAGSNIVNGLDGNDRLAYMAGGGSSQIDGGRGADTLRVADLPGGEAFRFTVTGATATDSSGSTITGIERYEIVGAHGADSADLGALGDRFSGGDGEDTAHGHAGNDALAGGRGNDALDGGEGNDILGGNAGIDTLSGGSGADRFRFGHLMGSAPGDVITDFVSGEDRILIDGSFLGLTPAQDTMRAITEDEFAAGAPDAAHWQFVYAVIDGVGILFWDPDGTGGTSGIAVARFTGAPALDHGDIFMF